MFKKIIISAVLSALPYLALNGYALQLKGVGENTFNQSSNNQAFTPVTVTVEADNEVTTEHGIAFLIPAESAIQWDALNNDNITIAGSAKNKVVQPVVPIISDDFYSLKIRVSENFKAGDEITVSGLTPRTYREQVTERFLALDVNGDQLPDVNDFFRFSVRADDQSDFIKPHPVKNAKVEWDEQARRPKLTWVNPKDYDYIKTIVSKRIGTAEIEVYSNTGQMTLDNTYVSGQEVVYEIFSNDKEGNLSEKVTLSYPPKVEESKEEEKEEEVEVVKERVEDKKDIEEELEIEIEESNEKEVDSSAEKNLLSRLFGYYKIRYQIKCLRAGISDLDSNCLWAKINMAYAQDQLAKEAFSLIWTDRQWDVVAKRLKFSQSRYDQNCTEVSRSAKYCQALGENLKRAQFFLNQK